MVRSYFSIPYDTDSVCVDCGIEESRTPITRDPSLAMLRRIATAMDRRLEIRFVPERKLRLQHA